MKKSAWHLHGNSLFGQLFIAEHNVRFGGLVAAITQTEMCGRFARAHSLERAVVKTFVPDCFGEMSQSRLMISYMGVGAEVIVCAP